MGSLNYSELLVKAQQNSLTGTDINAVVMAIAEHNSNQDKVVANLKGDISRNSRGLRDIEEEYPLLPPEADDLSKAVQRKGVLCMGGKRSNAYQDTDLRRRVYRDIYTEIKRQYGLIDEMGRQQSYKKLKRKYLKGAFVVVEEYVLPIALEGEVEALNEIDD